MCKRGEALADLHANIGRHGPGARLARAVESLRDSLRSPRLFAGYRKIRRPQEQYASTCAADVGSAHLI